MSQVIEFETGRCLSAKLAGYPYEFLWPVYIVWTISRKFGLADGVIFSVN